MKILCAGPTSISDEVLEKMGQSKTNPDLDPNYKIFHKACEAKISQILHTKATSFFMLGEAILALEAAICSLMEKQERVLVIYNGFFGEGFAEYVENFGGNAYKYKGDFERGINLNDLENFLKEDHDFSLATMVHCETPSGITNDIKGICSLLKKYNILSIVDSVSAIGGEYIDFDSFNIDVLLGGSQKCLSAPAGLGLVTISNRAKEKIKNRKTRVPSYYMNFENYYDFKYGPFPYTMNENLIYAIDCAIDKLLNTDFVMLHKRYAQNTRAICTSCGLELYPKDSFSNTLTALRTPSGITSSDLLEKMKAKGIMISKGVGPMAESIFRIGHMGNNINRKNFEDLYKTLDESFEELGIKLKSSLYQEFIKSNLR